MYDSLALGGLCIVAGLIALRGRSAELRRRVTERTAVLAASEADARRQLVLMRAVIDGMAEGVVAVDDGGRFILFNPAAERVVGRGSADVPPERWADYYRVCEADGVTPMPADKIPLVRVLRGEAVAQRLLAIVRDDRPPVTVDCVAVPLVAPGGPRLGAVVVFRDVTDARAKAAALRAASDRLSLALAAARMGVWEWDLGGGNFHWSPTCAAVTGAPSAAGLDDLRGLIHPDDRAAFSTAVSRALAHGDSFQLEYRVVRPDGRHVWVATHGRAEWDDASRPRRLLGTLQDVSERKATELELVESQDRFRRITDAAPAILWLTDPRVGTTFLSRGWYEFTGQSEAEAAGLGSGDAIHPDERARVIERFAAALRGRHVFEDDYRLRTADGTYRWVFGRAHPWFAADGTYLGLVGSVIDISDRKAIEEQLRQSEARFRTFVDHATDAFFLYDEAGAVVDVNRQACAALGYSRDELIGMPAGEFDPLYSPRRAGDLESRLSRDGTVVFETVHRRKDGSRFPTEVRVRRFTAGDRRLCVALAADISGRQTTERRLSAALNEKQVLLREVHHRVKNNLQVVCSLLDMQMRRTSVAAAADTLRGARDRVRSMAMIHEQLYQHDTAAGIDFVAYLRSLVGNLIATYGSPETAVALDLRLAPLELPLDTAVPCGLIVNELTSNALKHAFVARQVGKIYVEIIRSNNVALLTVRDDGCGWAAGVDQRARQTLGLQLVTALAAQIGGTVQFADDGGTVARLEFPLAPAHKDS